MPIKNCITMLIAATAMGCVATDGYAQCAGCGAEYNKADREATARLAERQRLERIDPPIQTDPLGNALIGGGVTGLLRGSASAAARAVVTGTAMGVATRKVKEVMRRN